MRAKHGQYTQKLNLMQYENTHRGIRLLEIGVTVLATEMCMRGYVTTSLVSGQGEVEWMWSVADSIVMAPHTTWL